jgi:ribose 5-phosphate isomerase RpiB
LTTGFEGGRHERRVTQIAEIEREQCALVAQKEDSSE